MEWYSGAIIEMQRWCRFIGAEVHRCRCCEVLLRCKGAEEVQRCRGAVEQRCIVANFEVQGWCRRVLHRNRCSGGVVM